MPDIWMDVDAALSEVPVNIFPLLDDTDFKSREVAITYDQAGMDLVWNFVTTGGAFAQTAVTPTTGGNYDWAHQGDGMYTIEIPASGGASINNDTEGFGWFTGVATGVLPWRGPVIGFRAAALNNALIDGGDSLDVNVTEISGDSTAADNCELMFDGTGYAGGTTKFTVELTSDGLDDLWDETVTLGAISYKIRDLLKNAFAVWLGRSAVSGTTQTYKSPDNTENIVVATVDASGQRTAITLTTT